MRAHSIGGFVEAATARGRGLDGIVIDPEGPQVGMEARAAVGERRGAEHAPDHHLGSRGPARGGYT